jgi:hypothetical protein
MEVSMKDEATKQWWREEFREFMGGRELATNGNGH